MTPPDNFHVSFRVHRRLTESHSSCECGTAISVPAGAGGVYGFTVFYNYDNDLMSARLQLYA